MEQHQDVVLQQRVGSGTTRDAERSGPERIGRAEREHEEEHAHDEHHHERPGDQRVLKTTTEAPGDHERVADEDQQPQQDAAFECAPDGRDVEQKRRAGRTHLLHVLQREVARDERPFHHGEGADAGDRHAERVTLGALQQPAVMRADAIHGGQRAEGGAHQADDEDGVSERAVH